jgi:hypothetical protein
LTLFSKITKWRISADEILDSRSELSENIKNILTDKLSVYNIEVLDTSLEDIDFTDAFTDAAEYAGQKDAAVIGQIKDILAVNKDKLTTEDVKNLLLYYYVQKWNGEFPETYFSSEDFYKLLESVTK